ncbi:MAG: endonuclease/exonuclease/phosphatase family protein [Melioribacteraceae bacterium]|nr:endonuclease/exonuclease/phosphatase family protein [Melioribacteraceae bacterium]
MLLLSCSSVDYISYSNCTVDSLLSNKNEIRLVTYNIKAIYDKEKDQIDNLMKFIKNGDFDFVLFQELFDESVRDEIIEQVDKDQFKTIISRVDYNSFPEFIFQDAGLFMMSRYPRIDLSDIEFGDDVKNSNGVIHMILEKEMSKTNDFLANKSVLGVLFNINDSTQLFLFTTHVQAIGTKEHKQFQLGQIGNFINDAVDSIITSGIVHSSENLIALLAGDFNSNAYSDDRFKKLRELLGNPRDLHMEFNGNKKEYTFRFRSRNPSRRFDYIFAYDNIGEIELKKITVKSISADDVQDDKNNSISDHQGLKATLLIN